MACSESTSGLFEATEINGLRLRNRFVRSATWTGLAAENGACTHRLINRMTELAKGGVGLIITGHAYVRKRGQAGPRQLGIQNDGLIAGLSELTGAVHDYGGKIVLQLAHAGIYGVPQITGLLPVAVSHKDGLVSYETRLLMAADIENVVAAFGKAAQRAQAAGFDGVQIHAAHGYLLNQFLSPGYNKRNDCYGGSLENRAAVPVAVIRRIRQAVGPNYTVLLKINARDFWVEGLELSDSIRSAMLFEAAGVNAIEISGGTRQSGKLKPARSGIEREADEAYFESEARVFRRHVSVPLMLVGGIRSYGVAKRLLKEQVADYICMSRPFIREPALINRWQSGNIERSRCTSDSCCLETGLKGMGIRCARQ